jgi:general secretion pathway protein A
MFAEHFGLHDNPFSETPSSRGILVDERFERALAQLEHFSQDGSLAMLTAATGLGKSSLLRVFIDRLNPTRFLPVYVHLTNMRSSSLLKVMAASLGEDAPARGKEKVFLRILNRARHSDKTILFLLDEAHLIPPDALTDLRLLVSSPMHDHPPIKILLCGQDRLLQLLKMTSLLDLLHRISVRCQLRALTHDETLLYIDFKLKQAGSQTDVFDQDAKALVHDYSGGTPRLINRIASASMILASSQDLQRISEDLVHQAMASFKLP